MKNEESSLVGTTEHWYEAYYARRGQDRNSLLNNPEVLFQYLAHESALIRAIRSVSPNAPTAKMLDVGCGSGGTLVPLLNLGFSPLNLYGVDIQQARIEEARARLPMVNFECADATGLRFPDSHFDLVSAVYMFVQVLDENASSQIASEMIRVTKPFGHILIADWRYSRPGSKEYVAVSQKRIARLFSVGQRTTVRATIPGALIPPIGRLLSKYAPSLYFLFGALAPVLRGQMVTVLQRI